MKIGIDARPLIGEVNPSSLNVRARAEHVVSVGGAKSLSLYTKLGWAPLMKGLQAPRWRAWFLTFTPEEISAVMNMPTGRVREIIKTVAAVSKKLLTGGASLACSSSTDHLENLSMGRIGIEPTVDREALRRKINSLPWFHQIDFGDGLVAPGAKKIEWLRAEAEIYFNEPLPGLTVLDIGCWDGFHSFEASRRGAKRVVATDHFVWHDPRNIASREAFQLAREHLAPNVEVLDIDIPELTPERIGTFDIVIFSGILYHLRNPFLALEQIARLVKCMLIVETHLDALDISRPAMIFYPTDELNNDSTNWWGPNRACVEAMLRDVGFSHIAYRPHPVHATRAIFHARRQPPLHA